MSLFPAFIAARKRQDDSTPPSDVTDDSRRADPAAAESEDNVFNLLPPETADAPAPEPVEPKPQGRNRHPVDMTDLSRLSIDRDGRLYWDGKPVETHHRLSLSRRQFAGACLVAAFLGIGAIGAALQGTIAARDWACRLGWSASACVPPAQQRNRVDFPA